MHSLATFDWSADITTLLVLLKHLVLNWCQMKLKGKSIHCLLIVLHLLRHICDGELNFKNLSDLNVQDTGTLIFHMLNVVRNIFEREMVQKCSLIMKKEPMIF